MSVASRHSLWKDSSLSYVDMIHRWSFYNNSLDDLAGDHTASLFGAASLQQSSDYGYVLNLPGGAYGTGYCSLGIWDAVNSGDGEFTVEMWMRIVSYKIWSRIIQILPGTASSRYFAIPCCNSSEDSQQNTSFTFDFSGSAYTGGSFRPIAKNTYYHIALTAKWENDAYTNLAVSVTKRNISTGQVVGSASTTKSTSSGAGYYFPANGLVLGRSNTPNDNDENADYAEVRIYRRALSDQELMASCINGPKKPYVL